MTWTDTLTTPADEDAVATVRLIQGIRHLKHTNDPTAFFQRRKLTPEEEVRRLSTFTKEFNKRRRRGGAL